MKKALVLAMAAALLGVLVAGCGGASKAAVECREGTAGFACAVAVLGGAGKTYSVCWDINVKCGDGQSLTANTCQDVPGDGKSTAVVPNSKFSGGTCKVNKVAGISVANIKARAK